MAKATNVKATQSKSITNEKNECPIIMLGGGESGWNWEESDHMDDLQASFE